MKGLAIILHSGSFDRFYHGLSLALAALALGRDVRLFFTYWAMNYLKKGSQISHEMDEEEPSFKILREKIEKGHLEGMSELMPQIKAMGAKFYACTNSMGLLNIARNELIDEVDMSMGLTTFLTETADHQLLFI